MSNLYFDQLPLEITDEIFAYLDTLPFDSTTLKACALVNKAWLYASRRIFFRSVDMRLLRKLQESGRKLLETVTVHAREVRVSPPYSRSWMAKDTDDFQSAVLILPRLTLLNCLVLNRIKWTEFKTQVEMEGLFSVIGYRITSLRILRNSFRDVLHFIRLLRAFPALTELTILLVMTEEADSRDIKAPSMKRHSHGVPPKTLKVVHFQSAHQCLTRAFMTWLETGRVPLTKLALGGIGFRPTKELRNTLYSAGSQLKYLHLYPLSGAFNPGWGNIAAGKEFLDLRKNNMLEMIKLESVMKEDGLPLLSVIFRRVTSQSLETIVLPSMLRRDTRTTLLKMEILERLNDIEAFKCAKNVIIP
ncbi:hypothetical protein CYLTODRAFT_443135 [Cylindrobasidium torrendii FP15055 ss-10]|uniref:F-box domain-containing protein n=1 Tax=Cylindrobasidium torrendii FP15055 ss-10 TaxID=1314674 RepID=A0A0D7BE94_9AGAR|nr:hypothetical protein CYLTODRAFT_443135 [Cylindrobasidium torrendii FP15055 ss-10]